MLNVRRPDGSPPAAVAIGPPTVGADGHDDAQLLQRIAAGDRSALGVLYQRHAGVVLAHLTLVTDDRGLSEEILQDTMLAVWHGAASYRGLSSVRSWIIAIARRKARDRFRRRRAKFVDHEILIEQPAWEPGPEEVALERATAEEVASVVKKLSVPHREVLNLVFGAGLTLAEAAEALAIPVGTVKSRMASAKAVLARDLAEEGNVR